MVNHNNAFHGNTILKNIVTDFINLNVTSFLETGTHTGITTEYIAQLKSDLPVYSCEVDKEYYESSLTLLSKFKNIHLSLESSEKFIQRLINEKTLGDLPMFFLDAHWYDYWPLKDEIKEITKLDKFIILVDDFGVPNQPQFENDAGGGGSIGVHRKKIDSRPCNITLFSEHLPDKCMVGYPNYNKLEAYGRVDVPHLRGHAFFVYNVDISSIKQNSFFTWEIL